MDAAAAHPRSRGEHKTPTHGLGARFGSSPLARGTHGRLKSVIGVLRLIPARAGNTVRGTGSIWGLAAHPRSRGEHARDRVEIEGSLGSSPLARGTHRVARRAITVGRLIPARAGNTDRTALRAAYMAAHPRSRGEHNRVKGLVFYRFGSSPLARGTLRCCCGWFIRPRLIPARAGNTTSELVMYAMNSAHPRSRGEHQKTNTANGLVSWLIPARAGNTPRTSAESPPTPAHPRSRGEHSRKPAIDRLVIGSSPLARGTLARRCISSATMRLIPARAGNTTT